MQNGIFFRIYVITIHEHNEEIYIHLLLLDHPHDVGAVLSCNLYIILATLRLLNLTAAKYERIITKAITVREHTAVLE